MLHESCDIVDDAGGWTCRTCRAHWRTATRPGGCADGRSERPDRDRSDRAAFGLAALLVLAAVVALVSGLAVLLVGGAR